MFFCCECCVLSGRGLRVGLITRREESYRLWCVVVCDREAASGEAMARNLVEEPQRERKESTDYLKLVEFFV